MIEIDWIGKWAMYSPDAVAVADDDTGESVTYAQAHERIRRLAAFLASHHHITPGDRVAVLARNDTATLLLFFAVQHLGAILVPINTRLSAREIHHILSDCAPRVLIAESTLAEALPQTPFWAYDGPGGLRSTALDASLPSDAPESAAQFDSPCMILYTSGTTGAPKGAILSNRMLFWNSVNTGLRLNLVQQDVTITSAPFFHTGGWNVLTLPFLHRGAKIILMRKFEADRVLELIASERISILFGVPTMMQMMRQSGRFADTDLSSVRYAIVGGEPMPLPLIRDWHAKGVPIRQGYGLTEFGPNVFSLNEADAERKIGSVGFPNFYIQTRVVDNDDRDVSDGEPGELILRGPVMMDGYWNNPQATADTIRDGWLHTGDIVIRDSEGYFRIVDRKKDMYISGAENVYPAEIEHFLRTHPSIQEVAVFGVPDAKWGEVGMACIVLKPHATLTAEEVFAFCDGQLARYKLPKHVRFLEALPKSDSGKILKRALKQTQTNQP
jgi:fatty-acyl-CoA synthase